jgi:hypothetical protein
MMKYELPKIHCGVDKGGAAGLCINLRCLVSMIAIAGSTSPPRFLPIHLLLLGAI